MALLRHSAQALLAALLLGLPLATAQAQDGDPVHGLWKVTIGPAQSAGGTCSFERTTIFAQIADWPLGGWLAMLRRYPQHTTTGADVVAVLPAQHRPDEWPEGGRPSQAVADQVNKLGLEYRFTGTLSADGNELSGSDTQICFYWQDNELTGYQKLAVPVRAVRLPYVFGAIDGTGTSRDSVKQGESFQVTLDTEEAFGWNQAWVQVLNTDPILWLKLLPDDANTRYITGPITIAEPPQLNLNLPAEALEGRLYAKPGDTLLFMVYPSLVVYQVTVAAP